MKKILLLTIATIFCVVQSYGQGGTWEWARLFDTIGGIVTENYDMELAVDDNNNLYALGVFRDIDLKIGTETLLNRGKYDVFICSFDPVGNFRWAKSIGSAQNDDFAGLVVDGDNIYVAGAYNGADVYFTGTDFLAADNKYDSFIAHYKTDGTFQSAKRIFWGQDVQRVKGLTYDKLNDYLVVVGQFKTQIIYFNGVQDDTITVSGPKDAFISRFDISAGFSNLQYNDIKTFYGDETETIFKQVSNSIIGTSNTGYYITGDCFGHLWITEND